MRRIVSAHWHLGVLLLILVLAGVLRLVKLDQVPPGLHVDEASNAWNAYTLLATGKDQHGVSWPVSYTRGFGQNQTLLYIYALIPFQAIWGLTVWTTRLPGAVGGVVAVLLIYFLGARLFGCSTGLVAAAMLAFNPWHLQTSRWGHDASIVPLLVMAPLFSLLAANMPFDDDEERQPRFIVAALAGAVTGVSCYGYWAVRLFLPVFLIGAALVTWRACWVRLKSREGALALSALLIAGAVTAGPLLWKHLTDPEINKRGDTVGWVWSESDSPSEKIGKVLYRYAEHFGLDFLVISGDKFPALSLPKGTGPFYWYDIPLLLAGLLMLISRFRSSRAARLLLVWVVLYPVGDLLNPHVSVHSLRSLPGLCGLVLMAAVGGVGSAEWLWQRRRQTAVAVLFVAGLLIVERNARFLNKFFGEEFYRDRYRLMVFGPDLLEAARWLRPRLDGVRAVFVTGRAIHPYIVTLVGLGYDPQQWFRDARQVLRGPQRSRLYPNEDFYVDDVYVRFGKIHFLVHESSINALRELVSNGRPDRVIFIVRPGQFELEKFARPAYEVRDPDGPTVLWVFDIYI